MLVPIPYKTNDMVTATGIHIPQKKPPSATGSPRSVWACDLRIYVLYLDKEIELQEAPMETTQNVTLAIPRHILRKAKILAVQKNTSLSGLLTQTLIDLVANQENFDQARQRSLAMLKNGLDLGTQGNISWKREELQER
jgi:hypothetical protein